MESGVASRLAHQFLRHFDQDAQFFSNSDFADHFVFVSVNGIASGFNLTDATFDTGVLGVDHRQVGILWVEDED
jgi:hypothetical protein